MVSFLEDFGILLLIIVAVSFAVKLLKQPIIMGYVLSGLLFSSLLGAHIPSGELVIAMSELGIAFLLFLMGLEFDLKSLRYLGKDIFLTVLPQSAIFFAVPMLLSGFFGFGMMERIYLSILFMFSSTLLVAKWLEDKKESSTLHGKLILGTLIVQDFLAILALTVLGVVQERSFTALIYSPLKGLLLIAIAFVLARYLLNNILRFSSRHPELLFIVSLGVCFLFVLLSPLLGYSATIGAFIGGITLANTIYKNEVASRLRPLIVFFNMLFFVGLGYQMDLNLGREHFLFIGILLLLSLLLKPAVIYTTLRLRKYDAKTSFITALHLAQLSEFGIIIVAAGTFTGAVGYEINSLAIILVILSMLISSYFIKYDTVLYRLFSPWLRRIDIFFRGGKEFRIESIDPGCHILLFGYYDLGRELLGKIRELGKKMVVVENDPESIEILKRENIPYIYNSVNNPEFLERLQLQQVELAVSSIANVEDNISIISRLKAANPKAVAIATAKNLKDSLTLYDNRADYVIYPSYLNHRHVSVLLEEYTADASKVIAKKIEDISRFKEIQAKRQEASRDLNKFIDIDQFFSFLSRQQEKLNVAVRKDILEKVSLRKKK